MELARGNRFLADFSLHDLALIPYALPFIRLRLLESADLRCDAPYELLVDPRDRDGIFLRRNSDPLRHGKADRLDIAQRKHERATLHGRTISHALDFQGL